MGERLKRLIVAMEADSKGLEVEIRFLPLRSRRETLELPWCSLLNDLREFWNVGYAPRPPAVKSLGDRLMNTHSEEMETWHT